MTWAPPNDELEPAEAPFVSFRPTVTVAGFWPDLRISADWYECIDEDNLDGTGPQAGQRATFLDDELATIRLLLSIREPNFNQLKALADRVRPFFVDS